ncbi:MAG: DUF4013 domain-containing protein [Chloroflexota bacterium]|nr:DUF4013 domain-containing protein [Chloroflexota bacterium]
MELVQAFAYIRRDRHCLKKMGEIALFVALCFIPVIGLIPLCVLLGYLAEIIHNVLNDYPRPLPEWDHVGEDVGKGVHVLLALVVYHLPLIVVAAFLYSYRSSIGVSVFGGITYVGIVSALLPFLFIYLLFAWTLFTIGFVRYADSWDSGEFYRLGMILSTMQSNAALTLQWLVRGLAASIALALLLPVIFLGAVLFVPVYGYLAGTYGRRLRAARMSYRQVAY